MAIWSVSNPEPSAGGRRHQAFSSALRGIAAGATLLAVLATALPLLAQSAKITPRKPTSHPHVYLMRGLLNVFSLGMDQLAAQIQSHGIDASVYNHSVADSVVSRIVQEYRAGDRGPYILIGHSLGADAVMTMAQQLDHERVPVALVVPFDGTGSYAAPSNVACVVNLTQRKYAYMVPGVGFHGKLSNVDVSSDTSIDHFTIDKSPRLQAVALRSVLQAVHGQPCELGENGAIVARQKEPLPAAKNAANGATPPSPAKDAPIKEAPIKGVSPIKSASPALHPGGQG